MAVRQQSERCLCSELVEVVWTDAFGRRRRETVNLGEIWKNGAVLESESPIRQNSRVEIRCRGAVFSGEVSRCTADFVGYLIEVEFAPGVEWSRETYEPEHFFDPAAMKPATARKGLAARNHEMLEKCFRRLAGNPGAN